MKKNSYLQIRIETENLQKLKEIARNSGLRLSDFCRQKLLESQQLNKIEWMLTKIFDENEKDNRIK
jgi:hypothetical protein